MKSEPVDVLSQRAHQILNEMDSRLKTKGVTRAGYETLNNFANRLKSLAAQGETFSGSTADSLCAWYKEYSKIRYNRNRNLDENNLTKIQKSMPI